MREAIVGKVSAEIASKGWDAIVTTTPENFAYLNGFTVPSQSLLRHRHAISILSAAGALSVLVVDMEEATVRRLVQDTEVKVWREFSESAMKRLSEELCARGLEGAESASSSSTCPRGTTWSSQRFALALGSRHATTYFAMLGRSRRKKKYSF